ncbi:hypothetical protein V6N12_063844 [Hibiscus sabdariffa]|uniref:Uncharacterized protein n=1 Tax=Hibiscus sabdariffa TaxID=183260 RepID=A0ABR2AT34_9ROSI
MSRIYRRDHKQWHKKEGLQAPWLIMQLCSQSMCTETKQDQLSRIIVYQECLHVCYSTAIGSRNRNLSSAACTKFAPIRSVTTTAAAVGGVLE